MWAIFTVNVAHVQNVHRHLGKSGDSLLENGAGRVRFPNGADGFEMPGKGAMCYNENAMELYLPYQLITSSLAAFLLDKAIKKARHLGVAISKVVFSDVGIPAITRYRLFSDAAMHGLSVEIGVRPFDAETPFTAFAAGERLELRLPEGLCDCHAHTQFAYCGRGIDLVEAAMLSQALGVQTQCFTEHAFALYFGPDALKFKWQNDADEVARVWRDPKHARMQSYRALIKEARELLGDQVRFGLEVDLLAGGSFCLAPGDFDGWDYLIGAVHEIADVDIRTVSDAELEKKWLRDVETLLAQPIRILAHPFRYFPWYHRQVPRHLYRTVAKLLKQVGVAAEINHHKNAFEVEFFSECLSEGVQLSLGTDAHVTRQAGDLLPHLKTLEMLGIHTAEQRKQYVLSF